jgi:hypothetical protein
MQPWRQHREKIRQSQCHCFAIQFLTTTTSTKESVMLLKIKQKTYCMGTQTAKKDGYEAKENFNNFTHLYL